MSKARARGLLRHRFWGKYSAVIALEFETVEAAARALTNFPDWSINPTAPQVLVWVGDGDALKIEKERLGRFGADVSKIDSLARSIDHGEPFAVSVPLEVG